ncbi:hypothetical protein CERSUDRAFT_101732 [Gelatoporia subvermispora B]|uniref:Uncharacterized protein n=1 Tax=Ceriporiopsis subvermispora (strain B) TaxID=914234 RepID=M2Q049_CERS8|nr:hypothetical protein CERSUDRAFT_101732 [Gelatoporia subvermispora B]
MREPYQGSRILSVPFLTPQQCPRGRLATPGPALHVPVPVLTGLYPPRVRLVL